MIPENLKLIINSNPYFSKCARASQECTGRRTIEHSLTFAGKKLEELFAYVPLCWYHHLGNGLNKRINRKIALEKMTKADIEKYPTLRQSNGFAYLGNKVCSKKD